MTQLRNATVRRICGVIGLILTGCGGGGGGNDGPADVGGPAASAALTRAADCDDLLAAFRADARAKIAAQADQLRLGGWQYASGGSPTPIATPGAQATEAPGGGAERPRDATDTNTQVPGVDEADVVETDGDHIYLLHGSEVVVIVSRPPTAMAVADRIPIEGSPSRMFVAEGRALVLSTIYDDGRLGGDTRCGGIGAPFPIAPWDHGPGQPSTPPFCAPFFTKLTLVDVTATPAQIVREIYVEGSYVAARRHGRHARVVVRRDWGAPASVPDFWGELVASPTLPDATAFRALVDAWEHDALAAIDASVLADWLPAERERVGDALVDRALTCSHAYVPPIALAAQGTTLIVGLDLASATTPVDDALLLGDTSEIHASADTLVLTHPDWRNEPLGDASTRTALHVFALASEGTGVSYRGSGFVPGTLLSQFALDVRDDVVRVVTSLVSEPTGQNVTRVTTARIVGETLVTLGVSDDLAPGEQLQGARFLGDRAYLVTFVRVDPLFVIDLSDPAHPRTLGEVTLTGFSQYLHPLDADHLLTIGLDATSQGQPLGVAARVFDVAEPTAPALSAEYRFPGSNWTSVGTDHLAFTFEPRLGLLALPLNRYGDLSDHGGTHGTLQLLDVSAEHGISLRGVIDQGTPSFGPCAPPFEWEGCAGSTAVDRGLFIDDVVYSIGTTTVQAHALDDLETPLATVRLP